MSEYATPSNNLPAALNPVVYFRISAFTLGAIAILGFILSLTGDGNQLGSGFLPFTYTHNAVHLILAAAAFIFGFGNLNGSTVKTFAILFGAVYLGLGVLGFFVTNPLGSSLNLNLTLSLNLVHVLLGGYGLASGLLAKFD